VYNLKESVLVANESLVCGCKIQVTDKTSVNPIESSSSVGKQKYKEEYFYRINSRNPLLSLLTSETRVDFKVNTTFSITRGV